MRVAWIVPLFVLCAPSAAGAQGVVEGQEAVEMKCVYAALTDAERAMLVRVDGASGTAEEIDQATDLIYRYAEVCAERHGWDGQQLVAAGGFALARTLYEDKLAALPPRLPAESLEAAAATLSDEDRYRFTSAGKAEFGVDPAWSARVEAALSAAGVAQGDMGTAALYLGIFHDALYAMQVFHELWVEENR